MVIRSRQLGNAPTPRDHLKSELLLVEIPSYGLFCLWAKQWSCLPSLGIDGCLQVCPTLQGMSCCQVTDDWQWLHWGGNKAESVVAPSAKIPTLAKHGGKGHNPYTSADMIPSCNLVTKKKIASTTCLFWKVHVQLILCVLISEGETHWIQWGMLPNKEKEGFGCFQKEFLEIPLMFTRFSWLQSR